MESYKISQLPQAESITEDDLLEVSVSSDSTYDSAKATVGQIATATMTEFSYDNLSTEDKTIIGAINELIGSGPSVVVEPLSVTENGTYTAEEGKAYSPVTVNIKSDIEKVVSESEWWDDSYLVPITVDGNPVTINSLMAQNAISTLLSYSPKQTGTGTPSPQNIMPIEGWTDADLFGCGKNLCQYWKNAYVDSQGEIKVSNANGMCMPVFIKAGTTITMSRGQFDTVGYAFFYDSELTNLIYRYGGTPNTSISYTATVDGYLLAWWNQTSGVVSADIMNSKKAQIEVGPTATDYEPYTQGANITKSLGGTYYGFTVDLENGTLTIVRAILDRGLLSDWERYDNGVFHRTLSGYKPTIPMCNMYEGKTSTTSASGAYNRGNNGICLNNNRLDTLYIRDDSVTTVSDFYDAIKNIQIIYELAEPQTVSLTPSEIALLAGNNTLFTDGDNISLTYRGEQANTPLLGMLGNAVLTQNSMVESEPTDEESNVLTEEVEENVSE